MKYRFTLIICALLSFTSQAQDSLKNLYKEVQSLKTKTQQQKGDIEDLSASYSAITKKVDSAYQATQNQIQQVVSSTEGKIQQVSNESSSRFTVLDSSIGAQTRNWLVSLFAFLGIIALLVYFFRKRLTTQNAYLVDQIKATKASLEQEGVALDEKLLEVMNKQLSIIKEQKQLQQTEGATPPKGEEDHTLALKVADEIIRINSNILKMDQGIKGLKQLSASVKRIQDNFEANGYELVEMLHKPFDSGMKVIANFRPDESLKPGEQVITRIIKPQVNYKGVMIQSAQIEVSQGEERLN